jgi:hypothetical protein
VSSLLPAYFVSAHALDAGTGVLTPSPATPLQLGSGLPRSRCGARRNEGEALRIVPNEVFERAQARTRVTANSDQRLKSGGRAKYLLRGLLVCNVCNAHYVIADASSYACSGHWNGRACSNHVRVRRDSIE